VAEGVAAEVETRPVRRTTKGDPEGSRRSRPCYRIPKNCSLSGQTGTYLEKPTIARFSGNTKNEKNRQNRAKKKQRM